MTSQSSQLPGNSPAIHVPIVTPNTRSQEPAGSTETGRPAGLENEIRQRLAELEQLAAALNAEDRDDQAGQADETQFPRYPADFCLSIVVPIYNEERTVRAIVAKLLALPIPKELILVDDGSTDGTRQELEAFRGLPDIRILLKPQNEGKGAALRTGFSLARGQIVLVQDADLEYDPRDIPALLTPILEQAADVVYGSRFLEQRWSGSSACHRFGNRLLTIASNLSTGLHLTDMETCYKVFRASALKDLQIRQNRFGFEPEVTAKLARRGLRFCELPVTYRARDWDAGKKIGWRDAFNAFYCIVRYAWSD